MSLPPGRVGMPSISADQRTASGGATSGTAGQTATGCAANQASASFSHRANRADASKYASQDG